MNEPNPALPVLSICCPLRDEGLALAAFFDRLLPVLRDIGEPFEIVCVNDGSADETLGLLLKIQAATPQLRVLDLSRNFGKEASLTCAIDHARGLAVVPIDADLQDPPELIMEMVRLWRKGFDVVLPQRVNRDVDSWLKRKTALWFYRLHNAIADAGASLPANVGDFRLMDRRVVDALKLLPERNRFMKGLFAWLGFRQILLPYAREARVAGASKFNGWRLWRFALDGLTSFSTAPLRIWTWLGLLIALIAFGFGLFIVVRVWLYGRDWPGYASLVTIVSFLGGIQLIGLGMIGEYIGRIYQEAKGRPVYVVRERYENEP